MTLISSEWKNKKGTEDRSCKCGSWKQHWINYSGESWPEKCSVLGCDKSATLGAHVINVIDSKIHGEYIIPACDSCNKLSSEFILKDGTTLVSANKDKTCEK